MGRGRKWLGVSQGIGGWFAMLYDNEGPIQTGIGRYATSDGAKAEAISWSMAEDVFVDFDQDHNLRLVQKGAR